MTASTRPNPLQRKDRAMNNIKPIRFRNFLAERGTEMTPEEAERAYKALKKFVKRAKKMSMEDIWAVERYNKEYAELYRRAKEI